MGQLYTIIGRGHSATRAISQTLMDSGIYMGQPLNESYDLLPPQDMYEACRVIARYVEHRGGLEWNFDRLHTMPIDPAFTRLIESYLADVLNHPAEDKGWKIPETTLCYPWIVRLFPDCRYIFWVRNPRDCILGAHMTDDMAKFGITLPPTDDPRERRAFSWKYQFDIVRATPPPRHRLSLRMEDFVLRQDQVIEQLGRFTGRSMVKIPVKAETVGRYARDYGINYYACLREGMLEYDYEIPEVQTQGLGSRQYRDEAANRFAKERAS